MFYLISGVADGGVEWPVVSVGCFADGVFDYSGGFESDELRLDVIRRHIVK